MATSHRFLPLLLLLGSCSTDQRPAPGTVWKDMTHEERHYFMKETVFPAMKQEFVKFDAKDFSKMTCVTCHGAGAKDHTFKMPNADLPPLPPSEDGIKELQRKHPEVVAFMMHTVVPRMAVFLGETPYNPETKRGFGCFRCHPMKSGATP